MGGYSLKYFMHYKSALGFIPSMIFSFIGVLLALSNNAYWVLSTILSILLLFVGVSYALPMRHRYKTKLLR